jgi:acetyl-CoA C-acetyltransferase
MKPALRLATTLGLALVCAAPAPGLAAHAAPQSAASPAAETPEARAVSQMVAAAELAAWGRERGDAEALRVAARMLDEVPLRTGTGGDPGVAPVLTAAGLRQEATAFGVNQVCGSGLRAVALAAQAIALGDAKIMVAGGQESMSNAPHCMHLRNGT